VFAPKFGLLFHIPNWGAVYGNVSRGFRQTDGVISDPTLPFITEWAYEAGVKLDRRGVSASAALFRLDVSNEQTFDPITLTSTSGGASRRQGVELDLNVRPDPWLLFSTDWTFTDARYRKLITEDGDTLNGARVFNTARYVGVATVEVSPPAHRWHLRVSTNAVGPYSPFDAPGVVLPAYALLHVSAGAAIARNASIEVGVRNLLNRAYPELRAADFVTPGQPRSLDARLRWDL
jgi:outer membrane receptor protein involved in Fe transport